MPGRSLSNAIFNKTIEPMRVDRGHAVLEQRGERRVLVFERVLPHLRERVWRALTERAELDWNSDRNDPR